MGKKFFWIKLKDSFFNQLAIKKLRKVAGGDTFVIIYLKMMLLSMNENGTISYECEPGEFVENLALDIDEDEENVKMTLAFLKVNGLLEYVKDKEIFLTAVPDCTGTETDGAERVRKHRQLKREKEKALENYSDVTEALQCNNDVTEVKQECTENVTLEIRDKRIDIRDKNIDKDIAGVVVNNIEQPPPKDLSKLVDFWNKNIHPITPFEFESLRDLATDYGPLVVQEAMLQACSNNVRKLSYVKAAAEGIANGEDSRKPKQESFDEVMEQLRRKYEEEANGGNH